MPGPLFQRLPSTGESGNPAKEIKAAVQRLVDAEVADSWKGGGDPADIPYIEQELEIARMKFDSLMGKLKLLKD